jgi:predicted GNAT family acetyltransferase
MQAGTRASNDAGGNAARYTEGDCPYNRVNEVVNEPTLDNPTATQMSATERSVFRSIAAARSRRRVSRYACGDSPNVRRNSRLKCEGDRPAARARSATPSGSLNRASARSFARSRWRAGGTEGIASSMARSSDWANVSRVSSGLRRAALRVEVLHDQQRGELIELVDADPIVNAVVSSRLRALGTIDPRTFGGALLGVRGPTGQLAGAAFNGGNLLPIGGGPDEWRALAGHVAGGQRMCTSIVGRAPAVEVMSQVVAESWSRARAVRAVQPLLVLERRNCPAAGDPRVRAVRHDELERYLPAASAMFTEELGMSPYDSTQGGDYRRRVAGLISEGRAFGIVDHDGSVIFKADIGAVSPHTCQVQGVWVRPDLRGVGLGRAALAAVLRHSLTLAPTVSLYVNDFNWPARRMYERLGMQPVATLATILF